MREPLRGAHAAGEAAVMPHAAPVMLGTAGWTVPSQHAQAFPGGGSHLERYSSRFPAVEINSSFYRPHRPDTYRRWAATVPSHFRFAVKIPKEITHLRRLADVEEPLERFLSEAGALGEKLGPLLLQLPPSFAFDEQRVTAFLRRLRGRTNADVACEPRHPSWFSDRGGALAHAVPDRSGGGRSGRGAGCGRARWVAWAGLLPAARIAADVLLALRA